MTDKKALLAEAINVDAATLTDISENRFGLGGHADGHNRNEYQVWTKEEAASFEYAGGEVATSDPLYFVYRIF